MSAPRAGAITNLQTYDWLMILLVLLMTIWGAWKGLARQLASLASLVVSYFVSLRFSPMLVPKINLEPPLNRLAAMAIVFVICSLVIWLLFRMVSGFIDRMKLQEFDRQMGSLIGAAQGVLLCVVVTFVAATVAVEPWKRQILTSRSGYYIGHMIDRAPAVLPREMHEMLSPYLRRLDEQLEHDHVDWEPADAQQPVPVSLPGK